jgi:hypothetical protein
MVIVYSDCWQIGVKLVTHHMSSPFVSSASLSVKHWAAVGCNSAMYAILLSWCPFWPRHVQLFPFHVFMLCFFIYLLFPAWVGEEGTVEEYHLLGCDAVQSGKRAKCSASCLHLAGCLCGLFFDPEDGISTFLRNIGELLPLYTVPHPRRQSS